MTAQVLARSPLQGSVVRTFALRLTGAVGVLLASASLTFGATHLMPGDPVLAILGGPSANPTPESIAAATTEYGLDKPLVVQYLVYLDKIITGDFGMSYSQRRPVTEVISDHIGPTLALIVAALVLAWVLSLLSGIITVKRGRIVRSVGSGIELFAASLPHFWIGIILLVVFAFNLRWLPPAGSDGVESLVLPAATIAIPLAGFMGQVFRESLDHALEQPFVVSARTRGAGDLTVRMGHALRHALLPVITLSGWAVGSLFSSAVVVEVIFSRKGLGRSLYQAVEAQDMPLAVGITLVIAAAYVLVNLAVDVILKLVDPRIGGS